MILAGEESASFFYGDGMVGTPTISAADTLLASMAYQQETATSAGAATKAVITSPVLALVAGNSGEVTVQLEDQDGDLGATSASDQTIDLSTTSAAGVFYATESSTTPINSVVILAGESSVDRLLRRHHGRRPDRDAPRAVSVPHRRSKRPSRPLSRIIWSSRTRHSLWPRGAEGRLPYSLRISTTTREPAPTTAQMVNLTTTSGAGAFYATAISTTPITSIIIGTSAEQRDLLLR